MKAQRIRCAVFRRLSLATLLVALSSVAAGEGYGSSLPLLVSRVDPSGFGVEGETTTVISATSFLPANTSLLPHLAELRSLHHEPGWV